VDREELAKLFASLEYQPEVDCISVCKKFFDKGLSRQALGQDLFAQKLQQGVKYFCCLPVKEAFRDRKFVVSQKKIQCLLVVPAWQSTPF
jgi:hypothetical protein